jgi:methionine aminotransferase
VNLRSPDYRIDWQEVRSKLSPRTRMILINTPHNPTGSIMTAADMLELQAIAEEHDLLVLSDEVYEHIVFDGARHESVARFPQLAASSLVVCGQQRSGATTTRPTSTRRSPRESSGRPVPLQPEQVSLRLVPVTPMAS